MGRNVIKTIGASNHALHDREKHDYYATHPRAVGDLLKIAELAQDIWEPACGEGHLSKELTKAGKNVWSTDIVDRGYGEVKDFLADNPTKWHGDIVTNPPYKFGTEFVERALDSVNDSAKVCMFLKILFLESKKRKVLFEKYQPKYVYVYSFRIPCAMNGDFESQKGSAQAYAWYIWEKGFTGDTILRWI